jgi:hypothetical protein
MIHEMIETLFGLPATASGEFKRREESLDKKGWSEKFGSSILLTRLRPVSVDVLGPLLISAVRCNWFMLMRRD